MSKARTAEEVLLAQDQEKKPSAYDGVAYSVINKDGKYHLVEIKFEKATLKAATGNILESNSYAYEIEEQFKIKVAEQLFD